MDCNLEGGEAPTSPPTPSPTSTSTPFTPISGLKRLSPGSAVSFFLLHFGLSVEVAYEMPFSTLSLSSLSI